VYLNPPSGLTRKEKKKSVFKSKPCMFSLVFSTFTVLPRSILVNFRILSLCFKIIKLNKHIPLASCKSCICKCKYITQWKAKIVKVYSKLDPVLRTPWGLSHHKSVAHDLSINVVQHRVLLCDKSYTYFLSYCWEKF